MNYLLLHKDLIVARFFLDEENKNSQPQKVRINTAYKEHFPIGGQMNNMKFMEWWQDRTIPSTRQGAIPALERLGYKSTIHAMVNNMCLSLNDCYWIKPENIDVTWNDVNLFTNDFVDSFGELTFDSKHEFDIRENTGFLKAISSQGEVQKKWCIAEDGRRFMVKGNYGNSYQQSINEVFATNLHELQGWKEFTPYFFCKIKTDRNVEGLGCMSYNFCSDTVESVSAWEMLQTVKIHQNRSLFAPFREVCLKNGMKEEYFDRFIDYQILSDFLISNTDRHMNNIAILRDPDSLKLIGFAPIYDFGNSMFYKIPTEFLLSVQPGQDKTHSFITSKEINLLKYVKDRSVLNLDKIDVDFSLYEKDNGDNKERGDRLKRLYYRKAEMLRTFQQGKDIWKGKYI